MAAEVMWSRPPLRLTSLLFSAAAVVAASGAGHAHGRQSGAHTAVLGPDGQAPVRKNDGFHGHHHAHVGVQAAARSKLEHAVRQASLLTQTQQASMVVDADGEVSSAKGNIIRKSRGFVLPDSQQQNDASASGALEALDKAEAMLVSKLSSPGENGRLMKKAGRNVNGLLAELEGHVNDLRKLAATPGLQAFIESIAQILEKDMKDAVMEAHNSDQQTIHNRFGNTGFASSCQKTTSLQLAEYRSFNESEKKHRICRFNESSLLYKVDNITSEVNKWKNEMDLACEDINSEICEPDPANETYADWVMRLANKFKYLASANRSNYTCEQATMRWNATVQERNNAEEAWRQMRQQCEQEMISMDRSACNYAKLVRSDCGTFDSCFTSELGIWNAEKINYETQEADRKVEWKAIIRIQCLLDVFVNETTVDETKLETCPDEMVDTSHLTLVYPQPQPPVRPPCNDTALYPCTNHYEDVAYINLPPHLNVSCEAVCHLDQWFD